jgi:hypothetical protein
VEKFTIQYARFVERLWETHLGNVPVKHIRRFLEEMPLCDTNQQLPWIQRGIQGAPMTKEIA